MLAKLWRFAIYRDSGPTLILDRLQQVEHEAYLTLMAGRAGVLVPDVLTAGRFGPSRDAALVTRVPNGLALSQADGADLTDGTLDETLLGRRGGRAGIDAPKLAEAKRVSWANLLFAVGSLIGIWLIIGVLSDAGSSLEAIKGASWGWVALAFVFAQLPVVAEAWALLGAAVGQIPFGRCVALETSNTFTALVGGDVAVFALRVRFFQRQGYDAEAAVSAGAIATAASWTVKSLLFIIAIPFAAGTFHAPSGSGSNQTAVWIILAAIVAAGIAATLIALVPKLRRLASRRIRPHLLNIWANVKTIAAEPHKIVYVLASSTLAQLLIILALGASLHAVGQHASIATLITVNTLAAIVGGAVPVPGGLGVVEAGLIAGLTSAGIPRTRPSRPCSSSGSSPPTCPQSGAGRPWPGCADANTSELSRHSSPAEFPTGLDRRASKAVDRYPSTVAVSARRVQMPTRGSRSPSPLGPTSGTAGERAARTRSTWRPSSAQTTSRRPRSAPLAQLCRKPFLSDSPIPGARRGPVRCFVLGQHRTSPASCVS